MSGRTVDNRTPRRRAYTLVVHYPETPPSPEECPRLYQWADDPGTDGQFIDDAPHWPVVRVWFSSRPAARRLTLLVTYGCTGRVVESDLITWPEDAS